MGETERRSEAELWAVLGAASGRDRVDVLSELADHKFEQREYAAAASLLESGAATSEEIRELGLAGVLCERRGAALFNDHEFEASADSYSRAVDLFRQAGWDQRAPAALWGQSDALRRLRRWREMLSVASTGLAFVEPEENGGAAGSLSLMKAQALYQLDCEEDALEECRRARDFFRRARMPAGVAEVDDFGHRVCMFLGRWDDALEMATNCYVIARSTRDPFDEAISELRLAETHIARDEFQDSLSLADSATKRLKELDDSIGLAKAALLAGQAMQGLQRGRDALNAYVEGRVLFEANGLDSEARECEVRRVILLHLMGRFLEAEVANGRLAEAASADGLLVDEAWSVARRVDNLIHAEKWNKAALTADEWYVRTNLHDPSLRAPLIRTLANKAYSLWMLKEHEGAFQVAEEALALTSEDDFDSATATIYEIQGRYFMDRDETRARRELAHAIALHLAFGSDDRARELSTIFMPRMRRETRSKQDVTAGGRTHDSGSSR